LDVAGTITADSITSHFRQPLQLEVGGDQALRLEAVTTSGKLPWNSSINVVAGCPRNSVAAGAYGASIAGGGYSYGTGVTKPASGSVPNQVTANFGSVGGGAGNTAGRYGTISGGSGNSAGSYGTVPGGANNAAIGQYSFAAGAQASAIHDGTFVWNSSSAN